MTKKWVIRPSDDIKLYTLQQQLNIHPVILRLLIQRGIYSYDDAKRFFRPSLNDLHDPFLMRDMDRAVDRIALAIQNREKILVYGDYDVDGTTSVALVYSFLKSVHADIDYYLPHRYSEGYGISFRGIDYAYENGFSLVIALDCGIKAHDKMLYAREKNIDFIICDHHLPDSTLPVAVATLDPKRSDCLYPYKELSGCGIGFKLISAFAVKNNIPFEHADQYLDLVALSIASDIVPITGENRVLAFYGLEKLNASPRSGLRSLIYLNNLRKKITISDLVFIIGPRINAAGRMDDARYAVKLLIAEKEDHAHDHAETLNQRNRDRQEHDANITEEALNMLLNNPAEHSKKTTVLFQPHWHKGVIGIVASRLLDHFYRPTILFTESNGMATGSARSVAQFDIYEAIYNCRDLLEQFGGHMFAAGLTLKKENLETFAAKFEEVVSSTIDENLLVPEVAIDSLLKVEEITPKFYNIIRQFAPFGPQNMKPVFMTEKVSDTGWSKVVGDQHIRFSVQNQAGLRLQGIGYGMKDLFKSIKTNHFNVCYTLQENDWNGKKRIEMVVQDVQF